MADPIIACPDFAQKALEKSEQLERSLDRSPRSSQAGAVCKKTAPPSSGSAWVPMARNALIVAAALTSCDAFGKIRVPPGAPWVTRQWTSPPKQQVGDGVQAATSNTRISPPAFEAPILRPALPDAAEAPPPPKAVLLSQTEINDLSECLKEEDAEGSSFAGAFSSSPSTRDLLTGRHRVGPGRRLISWFDCRKVIHKFNMVCLVVFVVYPLLSMAQDTDFVVDCYMCGHEIFWKLFVKGLCFLVQKDKYSRGSFVKCPTSVDEAGGAKIDCQPQTRIAGANLECLFATSNEKMQNYFYSAPEYVLQTLAGVFNTTFNSTPECHNQDTGNPPYVYNNRSCKILSIGAKNAAYSVQLSLQMLAMAMVAFILAKKQG
eukprot:GHVT01024880.1.p1 GENE.GHVT01024880.1~~GHVT01024880.1.p1  ORF type:complete len:393 (+),score=51.86 GHVT01024880.1:57-1181(+)